MDIILPPDEGISTNSTYNLLCEYYDIKDDLDSLIRHNNTESLEYFDKREKLDILENKLKSRNLKT